MKKSVLGALFLCALTLPGVHAGIIASLPSSAWHAGVYSSLLDPFPYPPGGTNPCENGSGGCYGNLGEFTTDMAASTDSHGLHAYSELDGGGSGGWATQYAYAWLDDTITNNTSSVATVTLGFHFDGQVSATGGSDESLAYIEIGGLGAVWDYQAKGSVPASSVAINQDYLLPTFTLKPGESQYLFLYLEAGSAIQEPTCQGPCGALALPQAIADAANTLSLDGFDAVGPGNQPLSASGFGSADGINYGSIDLNSQTPAPEPGTIALFIAGGVLVVIGKRTVKRGQRG